MQREIENIFLFLSRSIEPWITADCRLFSHKFVNLVYHETDRSISICWYLSHFRSILWLINHNRIELYVSINFDTLKVENDIERNQAAVKTAITQTNTLRNLFKFQMINSERFNDQHEYKPDDNESGAGQFDIMCNKIGTKHHSTTSQNACDMRLTCEKKVKIHFLFVDCYSSKLADLYYAAHVSVCLYFIFLRKIDWMDYECLPDAE